MSKIVWTRTWARRYTPFLSAAFIMAFTKNKKYGTVSDKLFVPEGNLMAMYFDSKQYDNVIRNYSKFLFSQNMAKYAIAYEGHFRKFLSFAKKLSQINLKNLSNNQIADLIVKVYEAVVESTDYQYHAFLVLDGDAADLEKYFASHPDGAKILQSITTPYKETVITKSRLELLEIAAANGRGLAKYADKYAWIPVYEPLDPPWTIVDFKKQLKQIKNPKEELTNYAKLHRQDLRYFKKFVATIADKHLKKKIEVVHYFAYLKEMRDDYRRHAYYFCTPLLEEISKRLKISRNLGTYLLPQEMVSILRDKSKLNLNEINKRKDQYAFIYKSSKLQVIAGNKAIDLGKKMLGSHSQELKGQVAQTGLVIGRVSVIYHQGEFSKFKTGEILVTTMTHPEFLPIMKKAKAIVTDEGGITCHAAIVARELGIPCIIGTKNATRVLKDGDRVEVDADEGVIKILK
jgi:phosphohistidine swiveling domain-containing protein